MRVRTEEELAHRIKINSLTMDSNFRTQIISMATANSPGRRIYSYFSTWLMIAIVLLTSGDGGHNFFTVASPSHHVSSSLDSAINSLYQITTLNAEAAQRLIGHNQALLPPVSYETVKRSQEETLQPSMQQLASSLMGTSASSYGESPEQNYTFTENEFYPSSPLYSNYYLNPQYYTPVDATGASSFAISPTAFEQFANILQATNQSGTTLVAKHKSANNKNAGLGRRIGEIVSNSAERASKAFKSFSQFKLFNDIKPSRLLGLVSEQSATDAKASNASALVSSPSSAWYYPAASHPWSSYVPPPQSPSSIYYQQPVYMRTPEMGASAASNSGSVGPMISPSAVSPGSPSMPLHGSKNPSDYMTPISDFYSQKLPLDSSPVYQPVVNAQSSSQYSSGASSTIPIGTSTTTVFHHYPNDSPANSGNNNQQGQDLYAAAQTAFGQRMKPPKDFDQFSGSAEDEMTSSGENDDDKMADNGGPNGERNGGRNTMGNNDGPSNGDMGSQRPSDGNSPWSGGGSPFDEYGEQNNGVDPDIFTNTYNPSNGRFPRPYNSAPAREHRPASYRPVSSGRPYTAGIRRPPPLSDFDDTDNWYNTFFGANVKPMAAPRLRPQAFPSPFASSPFNFLPQPSPSLLNSASTQTSTSLSPDAFMSQFMNNQMRPESSSPGYFHYPAPARPAWPYGLYPQANSYFGNFRPNPMISAASAMRPVTMPYFPTPNYFMPRYPYRAYPTAYPASTYQAAPAPVQASTPALMAPNAYSMGRYTPAASYPMMHQAASNLFPVRIPFSPMMPMAPPTMPFGMGSTILPAIAQPPMIRYRYSDLTPSASRRTINITRRAEPESQIDPAKVPTSYALKSDSRSDDIVDIAKTGNNKKAIIPNREELNQANQYHAYQILQRRMESDEQDVTNKSESKPQPYYPYYNTRDTTTTTPLIILSTPTKADSGEHLDSSARFSKSIKARDVQKQMREHENKLAEIKKFISEAQIAAKVDSSTTQAPQSNNTMDTLRHGKAVSQLMAPTDEWRPLLRPLGTTPHRKRH